MIGRDGDLLLLFYLMEVRNILDLSNLGGCEYFKTSLDLQIENRFSLVVSDW